MSARLRSSTTELEELGEETTLTTSKLRALVQALTGVDIQKDENTFKSIYDILLEIGKEWNNLTDVEQASLSEALFGKRNSQVGFAILNNVDRLQEIYALAENSEGSAMAEQEKYLEGVQYRIDQFQASVENLANTFMSSDFLKGMIQTGTTLVDILADIIDNLGTIPALIGAIGTAIGSKQNLFFNLAELGFTRDDKVLPLVPNSDLGALASTNATKQLKALATEYANLGTELSNTGLSQKEFIAKISEGNIEFATWLEDVGKDAPNQLKNYQKSLITTTLKTMGLRAVTMALQGALFAIAGVIITKVVSAISDWIHANERAIETGEEASRAISDINNNLKTQQRTVEDSAKRFAELSQGVDQLTGKNLSLSDEDYQEFLDISNQLVDVFPTLSYHYDENNNKIVDLNGSVSDITSSLQNLLKVEQDLARQKILENMDEVFEGAKSTASEYNEEIQDLNVEAQNLNSKIEQAKTQLSNTGSITIDENDIESFKHNLDTLGILYQGFRENINNAYTISIVGYESLSDEVKAQILNGYSNDLEDIQNEFKNIYKEKNQSMSSALSEGIAAWLYSDWNYAKLDEGLQANIQKMINNLDWSSLNFKDWNEAQGFLSNVISNIGNNESDFTALFNLGTQFNNGEITWGEFQEKMKSLYSIIEVLGLTDKEKEEVQKAFKILFDFEVDDENNVTNSYVENLRERFEKQGVQNIDEIIGKLTFDDIKALYNNSIDWKEFLKIHNLDNQVKYIKQRVRELSDVPFEINFDSSVISDAAEGISSLQSLYQSFYDAMQEGKVGEELAVQFKDVDELKEKLGNVSEYQDIWDEFYDTVTDGSHSFEEMEDALNQVLTAYVNSTVDLENFDRAQADAISTQLQLAGVTQESADAYVDAMVKEAEAVQWATDEGYNFATMSEEEIAAMLALAEQSGYSSSALAAYALEKQIVNGITITTSGDIDNLIALAEAAGVTTARLAQLAEAKRLLETAEATGDANTANLQRARIKYLTTRAQEDTLAELKALRNQSANLNYDSSKTKSSGSGGSSKETDLWKEAYEKELAALDHLHEMELISDEEYYKKRSELNEKYFANNTKYAEDYAKNEEEIYKGLKQVWQDSYSKELTALDRLHDRGLISDFEYYNERKKLNEKYYANNKVFAEDYAKNEDEIYKGLKEAYKSYIDDVFDYYEKALDAGIMNLNDYATKAKELLDTLRAAGNIDDETYYTNLAKYYGVIIDRYDMANNAAQRLLKQRMEALEDEKDALEESYKLRKDAIQGQIDAIQSQIDITEKEIDKLEDANKARQEAIDLQKALYEMNRAENQRSQMVYNSEQGFVYRANQQDIKNAQEEVENLRYQQRVSFLQNTVDTLNEQIDGLKDQIDSLDEELDKLTEGIDKQIDALQKYADRFGEISNKWKESQEDMVAATIWGSNWQTRILDEAAQAIAGTLNYENSIVQAFQNQYVQAQINQANATQQAANYIMNANASMSLSTQQALNEMLSAYDREIEGINKLINALKELEKARENASSASSSNSGSGGAGTPSSTANKNSNTTSFAQVIANNNANAYSHQSNVKYTPLDTNKRDYNNNVKNNGAKGATVKRQYTFGKGTKNAPFGIHEIAEDGNEIVVDNYGHAFLAQGHQLHKFEGGERVYNQSETNELLKGKYISIDSLLPDYQNMLEKVSNIDNFSYLGAQNSILNRGNLYGSTASNNGVSINIGDIHLSEVNDVNAFARAITNQLPNALLQEIKRR